MSIEARGKPPYMVSGGPASPEKGREQLSLVQNFEDAFWLVFDLSGGGSLPGGQYIVDAEGNVVFRVDDASDFALLREMDGDA